MDGTGPGSTAVLIDGEAGELSEIPEGENVHIVWRPIENTEYGMFAMKIVYLTDEAIEARKSESAEAAEAAEVEEVAEAEGSEE